MVQVPFLQNVLNKTVSGSSPRKLKNIFKKYTNIMLLSAVQKKKNPEN
jgi:hypothetical protein